jgi:REP element-mobilizing transposase RayT
MPYNPAIHNRHSIRLLGYDYSAPGAYFLTILSHKKEHFFGKVVKGVVELSTLGEIAKELWQKIPTHFSNVLLDEFVIMPNHIHGILVIKEGEGLPCKGKAFDYWLEQKNFDNQNHSVVYNNLSNNVANALPTQRENESGSNAIPNQLGSQPGSLPAIVQNYKSITSRKINKLRHTPGSTIWHRNYYEHIIRNEEDYNRILQYIQENPLRWESSDQLT